jgi:predicted DNA-binding protein
MGRALAKPIALPRIRRWVSLRSTHPTNYYYAREAILRHIEDIENYYLARRRLGRGGARVTLESLERDLKKRAKR